MAKFVTRRLNRSDKYSVVVVGVVAMAVARRRTSRAWSARQTDKMRAAEQEIVADGGGAQGVGRLVVSVGHAASGAAPGLTRSMP